MSLKKKKNMKSYSCIISLSLNHLLTLYTWLLTGSIPGLGRSPGEGNGNSFRYSCLGNPIDRRAYWATVYGVTESQAQLNDLHKHTYLQKYLWLFSLGAEWERLGWRWSEISLPNTENHISFLRRISQTRSYKLQQGNLWGGNSSYREYLAFFL